MASAASSVDAVEIRTLPVEVFPYPSLNTDKLEAWGEYEQVEQIGTGGMGIVYRARHTRLNRYEAIKVLRQGLTMTSAEVERFRFEAEATAALEHPYIVPVYGVGEVNGLPYFAMKWIDGGELSDRTHELRSHPKAIAALMAKVARAVHHAHRQGILHRDLKPSNVLLDTAGEPHVTDFGLAKYVNGTGSALRGAFTITGVPIGTPAYMSPEQARGEKGLTTAVDVYGLGSILYELLTGRPPFTGESLPDVVKRVATEPPAPPRVLDSLIDRDLEAICLKCLEKSPGDRYASAAAVAEDLEQVVAGRPVSVRPAGIRDWLRQIMRRKPEQYEGYAWEVKLWFGVIMAVAQLAIFGLVLGDASVEWVWAVFIAAWAAGWLVVQNHMGQKWTRLPETEKHSMMVAVGHIIAHIGITFAYVPFRGPASAALAVYPAQAVVSGLALFVIGTTHWGRFFLIGLAVMMLAPLLTLWPTAAPLIYGFSLSACMWYWAYAVKVVFGRTSRIDAA